MSLWETKPDGSNRSGFPIMFLFMRELRLIMFLLIGGSYLFGNMEVTDWQRGFVVAAMCIFAIDHILHFAKWTCKYYLIWSGIDYLVSVLFGIVFPANNIYQINFGITAVTLLLFTDNRRILTAGAVIYLSVWAVLWRLHYLSTGQSHTIDTLINFGFVVNSILVGGLMRFLFKARLKILEQYEKLDESHSALQEAHEQLHNYATQVETLTATRERNHIAREIHDTVGHTMTALLVQLQAARMLQEHDPVKSRETLLLCEELARSALQEVRLSVRTLYDEEAGQVSVIGSLRKLLSDFADMTGLRTSLQVQGDLANIPTSLQPVVYRIIQESLTNAKRHGNASCADVKIVGSDKQVEMEISDDGQGAAEVLPGFGLMNMRERVAEQGGTIRFVSEKGAGFCVQVIFPLQQQIWRYGGTGA